MAASAALPLGRVWEETEPLQREVLAAVKVVTHKNPDLDALLSLWIFQRVRILNQRETAPIIFTRADAFLNLESGLFAVDMGHAGGLRDAGQGKSIKTSAFGGSSCMALSRLLPDIEQDIMEVLVKATSHHDGEGEHPARTYFETHSDSDVRRVWKDIEFRNQLLCTSIFMMAQLWRKRYRDFELYRHFSVLFDQFLAEGMLRVEAGNLVMQSEILCNRRLWILPHGSQSQVTRRAFARGASVALYSSARGGDRWTLGIVANRHANIDFTSIFRDRLDGLPGNINVQSFSMGWGGMATLDCPEQLFKKIRDRFIEKVKEVMVPWLMSSRH